MKRTEKRPQKADTTKNGEIKPKARNEKDYLPLQIKRGLVILVPKEKCNDEYRKAYLKRLEAQDEKFLVGTAGKSVEIKERLTYERLYETRHMTSIEAAKEFGVSKETIRRYRKEVLGEQR